MRKNAFLVWLFACFVLPPLHAAQELTLLFVGDIMLAGRVGRAIQQNGFFYPFQRVAPLLQSADIAFGNLEVALTGNRITENRRYPGEGFVFLVPPSFAQSLREGGFDMVSLANNHAMDGGRKGLLNTLDALQKVGVRGVGAGRTEAEAYSLRILVRKGKRIGFLAFTDLSNKPGLPGGNRPGVAYLRGRERKALALISTARKKVDWLVVSVHWGIEGSLAPSKRQIWLAKNWVEAGADIIVGHHPHRIQPVIARKGKLIAYSLGNFVFDSSSFAARKSMILKVVLEGSTLKRWEKIPVMITKGQPTLSD